MSALGLLTRFGLTQNAGGAPPAGAYRYYRLNVTAANSGTSIGTIELELRESLGGVSVAVGAGGTATASQYATGRPPEEAFDGTLTRNNGCLRTNATLPWWLQYDFGAGKEKKIIQYAVSSYPTTTLTNARSAMDWTFQGSNDGVNWAVLDTVTGETGWTVEEQRVFTL